MSTPEWALAKAQDIINRLPLAGGHSFVPSSERHLLYEISTALTEAVAERDKTISQLKAGYSACAAELRDKINAYDELQRISNGYYEAMVRNSESSLTRQLEARDLDKDGWKDCGHSRPGDFVKVLMCHACESEASEAASLPQQLAEARQKNIAYMFAAGQEATDLGQRIYALEQQLRDARAALNVFRHGVDPCGCWQAEFDKVTALAAAQEGKG
jgi:hypothetical protein